jgi:aminocarboxymuconate-semialdehyde decarboxylase
MRAVDVHGHAMPRTLLERLARQGLADLSGLGHGTVRLDPAVSGIPAGADLPWNPAQDVLADRLAGMDAAGISHQAVSLPPLLLATPARDPAFVRDILRAGNDALAAHVAAAPDRLVALGAVPVGLPDAAREARRCLDELGMAGVAVGTQGAGRDLDDPVNEELWAYLAARRVLVFVHPSGSPAPARTADYWMPQLVGYPLETALAAARLVLGGVLERHRLTICLAHGGGCVPSLRARLDHGWRRKAAARTVPRPPSVYLAGLYYDTAVYATPALRRLVEDVGAARVVVGTDFPFDLADRDPVGSVRAAGLDEAETERILRGNAAGLLNLDKQAGYPAAAGGTPSR